jgi:hypothetical protein
MPASLDEGERVAIALAADIDAHLILLDDRDGVSFARAQGFAVHCRDPLLKFEVAGASDGWLVCHHRGRTEKTTNTSSSATTVIFRSQ